MKQPSVFIAFTEAAATFIERGERGIVAMILKSDNADLQGPFSYARAREIPSSFDEANKKQLELAFIGYDNPPTKVIGFVIPATDYKYTPVEVSEGDNPTENGWYELINGDYIESADTIAKSGTSYYVKGYEAVTPEEGDDPSENGWYELVDDQYVLTEDATVDEEKTYYSAKYTAATVNYASNPSGSSWYELSGGLYSESTDTYPVDGKTYYTRSSAKSDVTDYSAAYDYLAGENFQYLVVPSVADDGMTSSVVSFVKDERGDDHLIKAVLPNTAADNEGIINVTTPAFIEGDATYTAADYCSRVAGLLAGTSLTKSAAFAPLYELTDCTRLSKSAADDAADSGQFIALWDGEKVKMGRPINSLVTTSATKNTQFKKIKIVEAMDMIATDIRKTCEDSYIGKYANTYSNKLSLISAIRAYFDTLVNDTVLAGYSIDIDVEANETYLKGRGVDTSTMSDREIREANTGSFVYLVATLSMIDAMEDIVLKIRI